MRPRRRARRARRPSAHRTARTRRPRPREVPREGLASSERLEGGARGGGAAPEKEGTKDDAVEHDRRGQDRLDALRKREGRDARLEGERRRDTAREGAHAEDEKSRASARREGPRSEERR